MILAIVQARMGSTRLPGKTMLPFGQTTVLGYLLDRINKSLMVDTVVVATTTEKDDDDITVFAQKRGCQVYRGDVHDVLERFYMASRTHKADIVVRITADDPFKCPEVIDNAVCLLQDNNYDYVSNTLAPTFPEGIDVEVFTYAALEKAWKNACNPRHSEHVTAYIYENKKEFKIGNLISEPNYSAWRMTIDYLNDYHTLKHLAETVDPEISYQQLAKFILDQNLVEIMKPKTCRNEAYNEQLLE